MNSLMRRAQQLKLWHKYPIKNYTSTSTSATEQRTDRSTYDEFISGRRDEAKRSIVVQVSSEKSFNELYNYCSTYGNIVTAQHYRIQHEDESHYILLEFASAEQASAAIDASAYNEEMTGVPVRSPFLWFKAAGKRSAALKSGSSKKSTITKQALDTVDGTHMCDNQELHTLLRSAANIEEQVQMLHQHTKLNDLGVRMRFLAALQVQQALSGMFPSANAQPFGSSVNGFGKMGCDLDLILRFDCELIGADAAAAAERRKESRLVFHTKENLTNGRSQTQRQMESIGDMLHLFLPGVCHVRRILQARVPIIKYHHEHLDLEVDLSMSNLTGFYMSELLYMFGEFDERVRPLTFSVRRWATSCGLTNPSPGRWITNFSLTCLVMFFLQQLKHPILPSINTLVKSATAQDIRLTEDGVNCTFGRDFESIGFRSRNTSKVSELLLQFFEFYSQFDFHNRAISLNEGRIIAKPDHAALYIVNPLEQVLNVSKNISLEECERFRIEVRNAAWMLESEVETTVLSEKEKLETPWGILNLFKNAEKAIIRPNMFFKPRMVDVSDLFENNEIITSGGGGGNAAVTTKQQQQQATTLGTQKSTGNRTTTPTSTPTPTQQTINFKNQSVRQQVQQIKMSARSDIKQIRLNAATTNAAAAATTTASETKGRRSR